MTRFSRRHGSHDRSVQLRRHFRVMAACLAFAASIGTGTGPARAGDDPPNLSKILSRQSRLTFEAVSKYVEENPRADDIDRSYAWLFETAQRNHYLTDALPLAETYLKRSTNSEETATRARRMRVLGLAAAGKLEPAMQAFEAEMRGVNLRSPNETVDFAIALAAQAQMAGDYDAARKVLDKLGSAFFLNPYVRSLSQNRQYRLELAGRPAPELGLDDFDGKPVERSAYAGKLLLVDFWATNCAPCLEEFPAMKQLYADFHEKGLEIVGISLDEDRQIVDEFQQRWKLPWRMTISSADGGATRARYRARTIPSMFLIDQKGRVAGVDVRGNQLRRSIEQLLNAEESKPP